MGGIGIMITKEQVEHVAHLARLHLTEEEKETLTKDLEAIIDFSDQLNALNIENVEPTAHILPIQNVFRKDEAVESLNREHLLKNAPSQLNGCFNVPKIVE